MPFVWDGAGQQLTPDAIAARRKAADALLTTGMDTSPVKHWTQGAARVAQAMLGTLDNYQANAAEQKNVAADKEFLSGLTGGSAMAAPAAAPAVVSDAGAPAVAGAAAPPDLTAAVKGFEGFAPTAYSDFKQNSVGYGTRAQFPGERIDEAEASRRLDGELGKARASVEAFSPNAPAGIKDALTSLTYNAGPKWQTAGLGQDVQAGMYDSARDRFLQYNRAGGQVNPGLVSRRQQEAAWFDKPLGQQKVAAAMMPGSQDEAALPAGSTPAQYVVPGTAAAAPQAAPSPGVQNVAGAMNGVNPKLLAAVASPYMSEGTKKIAALMLQQQMKPQEYTFSATPDGTILKQNPRTGVVEPAYQAAVKPITIGSKLVNPTTGQVLGNYDEPKTEKLTINGQEVSVVKNPDGSYSTPKITGMDATAPQTVTGPGGKQVTIPADADAKTFRTTVSREAAEAASGKQTEVQAKDSRFADKMILAERNLGGVEGEGQSLKGRILEGAPTFGLGNYAQSENYQRYSQARNNFITALLRDESGAAIGSSEFTRYEKELFPQPGDSTAVIAQKREARAVAIEGMKRGAGPAYKSNVPEAASAAHLGHVEDGYRYKGGPKGDPSSWEKI